MASHTTYIQLNVHIQTNCNTTCWCHALVLKKIWERWIAEASWGSQARHPRWLLFFSSLIQEEQRKTSWSVWGDLAGTLLLAEKGTWVWEQDYRRASAAGKPGAWSLREGTGGLGRARTNLFWIAGWDVHLSGILCAVDVTLVTSHRESCSICCQKWRHYKSGLPPTKSLEASETVLMWHKNSCVWLMAGRWCAFVFSEWMNKFLTWALPPQNIDLRVMRKINWRGRKCY